eukprot:UN16223
MIAADRPMIFRENKSGTYSRSTAFITRILVDILFYSYLIFMFHSVFYLMAGIDAYYIPYVATSIVYCLVYVALFELVAVCFLLKKLWMELY